MRFVRVLSALALLTFVCPLFAQTFAPSSIDAEKAGLELEKKGLALLNQVSEEAASLKLPENRIFVLAATGEMLWKRDEKRARRALQLAANEITQFFAQYDETDDENQHYFYAAQNMRQQLLHKIGELDPEFALELLRQTRLPVIRAFLESKSSERSANFHAQWQAHAELQWEQSLATRAAQKNPARAIELVREFLKRDLTHNIFELIEQIKKADEKVAAELVEEIAAKMIAADWTTDYNARNIATTFINQFAPQQTQGANADGKKALVAERTVRDVAEKLASAYLTGLQSQQIGAGDVRNILPLVEKYAPNRAAVLRQRAEEMIAANPQQQFYDKLSQLQQEGTAEQILAEINNFPPEFRSQLYQNASNKIVQAGDENRARQILEAIPSKSERENALRNFDNNRYYNALNGDKLTDAYRILASTADERVKFEQLNHLALTYHSKKHPEMAEKMLDEARRYVAALPDDEDEMQKILRLARTTAVISPERAFSMLEPLVNQANELIAASAVVSKFYKRSMGSSFREGEWILQNSNAWGLNDIQSIQLLAERDFERLLSLANRFERNEVRIALRLTAAQAVLHDKNKFAVVFEGLSVNGSRKNSIILRAYQ
jgi:hypothetical protein